MCRLRWVTALMALAVVSTACGGGSASPRAVGEATVPTSSEAGQSAVENTAQLSDLPAGTAEPAPSSAPTTAPPPTPPPTAPPVTEPTAPPATPAPAAAATLSRGSTGDDVIALQAELIARGYQVDTDGEFGPGTEQAVRDEQDDMLLPADGIVGPVTRASLGLGTDAVAPYSSTDEFVAGILAFLSDGSPSGLPADALTALEMWRDSDTPGVDRWAIDHTESQVGGRLVTLFVLSGDGGVFNTLQVCTTPPDRLMWCGVWSASFH